MGVKGLNSALNISNIKGSYKLSSLAGKTLAVDICVWLHQFIKSKPRYYQVPFLGCDEDYVDDLEQWLNERMEIFIYWDIKLIFVGEGDRNPLKSATNEKRRNSASIARTNLQNLCQNADINKSTEANKLMQEACTVTSRLWFALKSYCQKYSVTLVGAVMEADGQLVALHWMKIVSGIITIDTDLMVNGFGVDELMIIYDIQFSNFLQSRKSQTGSSVVVNYDAGCTIITIDDIKRRLSDHVVNNTWLHLDFAFFCTLLGTDFWLHTMTTNKATNNMVEWFKEPSRDRKALQEFIQKRNLFSSAKYGPDSVTAFVKAVDALLHPLVYVISNENFLQKRFSSLKIVFLSDLCVEDTTYSYGIPTGSIFHLRTRPNLRTVCQQRLGFQLDEKFLHEANFQTFFTMTQFSREYGNLSSSFCASIYDSDKPRGSFIDFNLIPVVFVDMHHLQFWLHWRGYPSQCLQSKSTSDVRSLVSRLIEVERTKGSQVKPWFGPKVYQRYNHVNDVVQRVVTVHKFRKDDGSLNERTTSIIVSDIFKVTDDIIDQICLGHNRPGVKERAMRRLKGGGLTLLDITIKEIEGTVSEKVNQQMYMIQASCSPSMKSEDYSVTLFVNKDGGSLVLPPYTRCSCMNGRFGCSHLLAFLACLHLLQTNEADVVVDHFPVPQKLLEKTCVTVSLYAGWSGTKAQKGLVDEEVSKLRIAGDVQDNDEMEEMEEVLEDDPKSGYTSLCKLASKWLNDRKDDERKYEKKRKKKDCTSRRYLGVDELHRVNTESLYRGPNQKRQKKTEAMELHELYDEAHHRGPVAERLPPSAYSHYLYHTRKFRADLLRRLKDPNETVEVKQGFEQLPPGVMGLADRGFTRCLLPNCNPIIAPSFTLGRDQFEKEEAEEDMSAKEKRYTSEVFFSRVTDSAVMDGKIAMKDMKQFYPHLAFSHARCNIAYEPLAQPADWDDYVTISNSETAVATEEMEAPRKKKRKRLKSVKELRRSYRVK